MTSDAARRRRIASEGARIAEDVRARLASVASASIAEFFEANMSMGPWRGVDARASAEVVRDAIRVSDDSGRSRDANGRGEARYAAAFELIRAEYCDDKLAGMILLSVRRVWSRASPLPPHFSRRRLRDTSSRQNSRHRASSRATRDPSRSRRVPSTSQEHVLTDPSAEAFLFPRAASRRRRAGEREKHHRRRRADVDDDANSDEKDDKFDEESHQRPAAEEKETHSLGPLLTDVLDVLSDIGPSGVHDWSTADWLAAKVVGPYLSHPAHPSTATRRAAAADVARWASADAEGASPWLRRVGLTSFSECVRGAAVASVGAFEDEEISAEEEEEEEEEGGAEARDRRHITLVPIRPRSRDERRSLRTFSPGASLPRRRGGGGDELFGDGFVAELAAACGAAYGVGARGASPSVDAAATALSFDPREDVEAWVRMAASFTLSLCAAESRRMAAAAAAMTTTTAAAATAAASRKRGRTTEVRSIHWFPYDRIGEVNAVP